MINKIWIYLGIFFSAIAGLFMYGRSKKTEGKEEATNEQRKEVLDNVKKAKESEDDTLSMSERDRIKRMRERANSDK